MQIQNDSVNKLVSIVVPVFNKENYLSECIESILSQTYLNIQVILVNDGSTDNSISICEKYKNQDARIEVVDEENHGVSFARNLGIVHAKGSYILFVDADDYINKYMVERLVQEMEKNKVGWVECGWNNENNYIGFVNKECKMETGRVEHSIIRMFNENHLQSVCNKIYSLNLIKQNKMFFDESVNLYEDCLFNIEYYRASGDMWQLKSDLYGLRRRVSGKTLSTRYNPFAFQFRSKVYYEMIEVIGDNKVCKDEFGAFNLKFFNILFSTILDEKNNDNYHCAKDIKKRISNMFGSEIFKEIILNIKENKTKLSINEWFKTVIVRLRMVWSINLICKIRKINSMSSSMA